MICPKCGKNLRDGVKFCSGCGTSLQGYSVNAEKSTNDYTCKKCGTKLRVGAHFCQKCGWDQSQDYVDEDENVESNDYTTDDLYDESPLKPKKKKVIIAIIVAVLLMIIIGVIGVGVVLFLNWNKDGGDIQTTEESTSVVEEEKETESETETEQASQTEINDTPFYGIWCEAYEDKSDAENKCKEYMTEGLKTEVVASQNWSNLNSDEWYVICAGAYTSEEGANKELSNVQQFCSAAYVKYSGTWQENSPEDIGGLYQDEESVDNNNTSSNDEWIFEDSDQRYLTDSDLDGLSEWQICLARNELYARKGYHFSKRKDIAEYFEDCSWYEDLGYNDTQTQAKMNKYEKTNREFIVNYEKEHNLNQ